MQRLWVLSVFSLLLGAAYQRGGWGVTWARQGGFIHPVSPLSSSFVTLAHSELTLFRCKRTACLMFSNSKCLPSHSAFAVDMRHKD